MGLDAVVYRNKKNLNLGPDEETAQLIPETGEVYFANDETSRRYEHQRHAARLRLGNITEVAELRDEILKLAGPESLTFKKIVYSGTHSGDVIPVESLPLLSAELRSIGSSNRQSPHLRRFVHSLEKLIRAAEAEGNPIVFV